MIEKFDVSFKMAQDELAHHLLPRDNVIHSIVVENEDEREVVKKGKLPKRVVTDFISFYNLPSQILRNNDT